MGIVTSFCLIFYVGGIDGYTSFSFLGSFTISSNLEALAPPFVANTAVIAAVVVVLPWSTCPMVPILTWGLVLSNLDLPFLIFLSFNLN